MEVKDTTPTHPLDGVDPWECHDQHIAERNKLIAAKRDAEDGFIKTIVQLCSAILLAVPAALKLTDNSRSLPTTPVVTAIAILALSLTFALSEQFLSSLAYEKQLAKTDAYYRREISDVSSPTLSKIVRLTIIATFASFLIGTLLLSSALLLGPWRTNLAQTPTPRPTPTPAPSPPRPYHDSPGRSVPPTPPPAPPMNPRR